MSCTSSRCRSFVRSSRLLDRLFDWAGLRQSACCKKPTSARLRLLNLEDRVVPAGSTSWFADFDAVGLVGKTVSVTVTHDWTSGDVEGLIDWNDGSTTDYSSWPYTVEEMTFTHTYSAGGSYVIETQPKGGGSADDSETIIVRADVPPSFAVDVVPGMEFGAYATSSGNNPKNTSTGMVRYADGVVDLHFPDLESTGYGMPFGITRSWSNGPGYDTGTDLGPGWNINQLPTITQVDGTNTLSVVIDGNQARTFDVTTTATIYQERFFGQHKLTHDTTNDLYVLTTPGGVVYKFQDFTHTDAEARGTFDSRIDANGNETTVYSRSSGQITEIRRGADAATKEAWVFTYTSNKLTSVALRRGAAYNSMTTVRRVEYDFYGSSEDYGNDGDLKTAQIFNGSDTIPISTQYWRYYLPHEPNGFAGALKSYLGFSSYDRAAFTVNPQAGYDVHIAPYVDLYFEWDSSRRVALQKVQGLGCSMCSAGVGTYEFEYDSAGHGAADGTNNWSMETIETLPDGHENIVFTNAYGQVMMSIAKDTDTDDEWITHLVYDGQGRLIQKANPSATINYATSEPSLAIIDGVKAGLETDFQVNTYTTGYQWASRVASDRDGDFVVVWMSAGQDGDGYGIYAQRFNKVGVPQGSEFRVNTTTTGNQTYPKVAMDPDGNFVVVWVGSDGDSTGIFAQRYDDNGAAQGSQWNVNAGYTWSHQHWPSVATDYSGDFIITWQSYQESPGGYGIYAQRYNSAGTAQGSVIHINSYTTGYQYSPNIAMDEDGDFVVVWFDNGARDGDDYGCYGRRFNASGTAQGSDFQINTTTTGRQQGVNVTMDADGNFVATWTGWISGNEWDVFAQRYNSSGTAQGSEFRVNSNTASSQHLQSIASSPNGDFVITWTDDIGDGHYAGVWAKYYMADGTAGSPYLINGYLTNGQFHSHIAADHDGDFVVSWTSDGQDGGGWGIFARQLQRTFSYVSDTTGLVERYHYARVSTAGSDTTTGTGTAGDIAGFLKSTWLVQGEIDGGGNNLIKQNALTYFLHSDGTNTVSPLATSTVYRNADATGGQTTTMGYTWASSSLKLTEVTVTHPTVTTGQNGPNSAVTEYMRLDSYSRQTWTKDGDGFLIYRRYDDPTGATTYSINDVDTSQTTTFTGSAPWSTPGGGGLHLTSSSTVDFMGRATKSVNPLGYATFTVFNDPNHETRVYPAWDSTLNGGNGGPTGPTQVYREDWSHSYNEQLTMSAAPNVSSGAPTGSESISGIQSLSRTLVNDAGQPIWRDDYYTIGATYSSTNAQLISSGWAFYETKTDYAARGGVKRTETPTGTITRYHRDALNRVIEVWIGTNDTPTTGYWSPSNNSGANMVKVNAYTFDGGGVGDGNMTKMVADPGAAADRRNDYFYDWRNRLIAVKSGVESNESATMNTQRPLSFNVYNNLNQVIESRTYDGDNVTINNPTTNPSIDAGDDDQLRSLRKTEFDERGRVFATHIYSVNQSTGVAVADSLTLDTNVWYDARGNTLKQSQPGGLVTKFSYDGVGRLLTTFHSDGGSDSGYSDADDVTSDTVYEEVWNQYDSNSNLLKTTTKQRFHDASGTGALQDRSNQPKARISYAGMYYDKADRLVAQVNEGTNAGSTWTWSSTVPTRSATELLYTFTYDSAGRRYQTVDPRGIESRTYYDALSRTTKTIEAYVNGTVSDQDDKTTEFGYDGMNHLTSYKAWLNSTDYQETGYQYGVTVAGGSEINSNDLLLKEKFPDKTTNGVSSSSADHISYKYNALGQRIEMTDRNGNVHAYSFDVVGRPTADAVTTLGSGVDGTVRRLETAYDTGGRAYLFTSRAGSSDTTTVVNQVQREFNGLGQMTVEHQEHTGSVTINTSPKIQYAFSEMASGANHSRLVSITYPIVSGVTNRTLAYNYDGISRITSIVDGKVTLEGLDYLGLSTVVQRTHSQPGVDLTYVDSGKTTSDSQDQYTGLDRFGRIIDQRWTKSGTDKDRILYSYDENSNRLTRDVSMAGSGSSDNFDEKYAYDSLNQLAAFDRGVMSGGKISSPIFGQSWNPDALGNFESVTNTTYGSSTITENRTHNRQNQLGTMTITGSSTTTLSFDNAGSMNQSVFAEQGKSAVTTTFTLDAWNRTINFKGSGRYAYDPLNRRIKEDTKALFYSNNWQVLEERTSGVVSFRYAWSPVYIDAMIARDEYTSGSMSERLYAATDANYNVTALINTSGGVDERFGYDPFGSVKLLDNTWTGVGSSANNWVYLHQDGRLDETTGMYHFRNRDADADLMRWNRVDPVGFSARDQNLFRFEHGRPIQENDPYGLAVGPSNDKCGPNVTEWLGVEMLLAHRYVVNTNGFSRPIGAIMEIGRKLLYAPNTTFETATCPTSKCAGTVSLCGTCIDRSEIGNIMYGFIARLLGLNWQITTLGGWYGNRGEQTPADKAGIAGGYWGFDDIALPVVPATRPGLVNPIDMRKFCDSQKGRILTMNTAVSGNCKPCGEMVDCMFPHSIWGGIPILEVPSNVGGGKK